LSKTPQFLFLPFATYLLPKTAVFTSLEHLPKEAQTSEFMRGSSVVIIKTPPFMASYYRIQQEFPLADQEDKKRNYFVSD